MFEETSFHGFERIVSVFFWREDQVLPDYEGYYSGNADGGFQGFISTHISDFDAFYAVLRSERPVYLTFTPFTSATAPSPRMHSVALRTDEEETGEIEVPASP